MQELRPSCYDTQADKRPGEEDLTLLLVLINLRR